MEQSTPPAIKKNAHPAPQTSAFVVLKPQTEAAGRAPHSQPPQLERTVSVIEDVGGVTEDQEGEVTYRKVSKDDEHSRVVTIRSKVRVWGGVGWGGLGGVVCVCVCVCVCV